MDLHIFLKTERLQLFDRKAPMSLNWKEIALIISEEDITGSKIQSVVQNSFHSLTWEMYSSNRDKFYYYTEIGTNQSRLHVVSQAVFPKIKKLQRFIQFTRKNIEGSVITSIKQLPYDRCVVWYLDNHGKKMKIYIRLYSGSGANIIVTDENDIILDLLLRRPNRDEISGQKLVIQERTSDTKEFTVRPYEGSFNAFIEQTFGDQESSDNLESLTKQVLLRKEHELTKISGSINSTKRTLEENKDFNRFKHEADLLTSVIHQVRKGDSFVKVFDWQDNKEVSLSLDRSLGPGDNVKSYFDKFQRAQGSYKNALSELEKLENDYKTTEERFNRALIRTDNSLDDISRLKKILEKTERKELEHQGPGIRCTSGGFELLVGRNAKENDELLRHYAKGNDTWLHTRDYPGGYVFIKFKRDKTIPLEVLLDAANLATLFSKGRNADKVDLYYTQVRFLRRAKDAKTGLVLPTQEKNLTIKPDRSRIDRLIPFDK